MLRNRLPWRKLEERRKSFATCRAKGSEQDDQFAAAVCPDGDIRKRQIAIVLRQVIARDCGVVPSLLWAADETCRIAELMGGGTFLETLFGGPYGFDVDTFYCTMLLDLKNKLDIPVVVSRPQVRELCDEYWPPCAVSLVRTKTLGEFIGKVAEMIWRELPTKPSIDA